MAAGKSRRVNRKYKTKYRVRNWSAVGSGIRMLRMDLRGYQLGRSNLNVFNADGISGRHRSLLVFQDLPK